MGADTPDWDGRGRLRRPLVAIAPFVVATAVPLPLYALFRDRLPDRVYTTDREPRFALAWVDWAVNATTIGVVATAGVALGCAMVWRSPTAQRSIVAISWALAVGMLSYVGLTVASLVDATAPPAPAEPWWRMPAQIVVVALAAAAGWRLAGPIPSGPTATGRPHPAAPRIPLADGERVVWSRSMFAPAYLVTALLSLAAGGWLFWLRGGFGWAVLIMIGVAVVTVLTSVVRVTVDGTGVTVIQPLLLRVRTHVDLAQVSAATVRQVRMWREFKGGYGMIDNGRVRGHLLRSGDALSLSLADGREFLVTVDGAATAAGLVNAELDRQRSGRPAGTAG